MKVFLTGASGLLGNALAVRFLEQGWQVHASSNSHKPTATGLKRYEMDLSGTDRLSDTLGQIEPDAIVNAAALSIPAECTKHPGLSKKLNLLLPQSLANYAAKGGIRFIHYSTDMVFDGKKGNYTPDCSTHPTNLYGEHKLESESRVFAEYASSCIVRLPLLTGNSPSGTRSVHEALYQAWNQSNTTPLFEDEWRNPVSVTNVASLTAEILKRTNIAGLYHWGGATRLNRWVMGNQIADRLGVPKELLQRTQASSFPEFKNRPLNLTINSSKLKALVQTEPAPFQDQLDEMSSPKI